VEKGFVKPLDQYLAQQGWIVFEVTNRGEEGRGTAFQKPAYRALGGVEVEDQLAALKWLKGQPFVDPERVGVYGWSYGGYMVLKLLEAAPNAFAAGVSGAPVTRWELYDTHYTERYMGNPITDPEPYRKASALEDAAKIEDPLLVIHGLADDNVLFENTTALMARLQEAKRPFEVMVYPGRTHSIGSGNVGVHLWQTIERFMNREVKNKGTAVAAR
jgi:dipeptidyl-peptidase-4